MRPINSSLRIVLLTSMWFLCWVVPASAIEGLDIETVTNPSLLPYNLFEIKLADQREVTADLFHPMHVLETGVGGDKQAIIVVSHNGKKNEPDPFIFSLVGFPPYSVIKDRAVPMTINSWLCYRDKTDSLSRIVAAGYRGDSAFVVNFGSFDEEENMQFLIKGGDGNGDSAWIPVIGVTGLFDYDYDGRHEALVYLDSRREQNTRYLFCVEATSLEIEWSLPVSSTIDITSGVFDCRDSLDPSVMFASKNPYQGRKDKYFNDKYGYLTRVNSQGEVVFHKIASIGVGSIRMIPTKVDGQFFVMHDIPFADPSRFAGVPDSVIEQELATNLYYVSRVDRSGAVLNTITLTERPRSFWLQPVSGRDDISLFVRCVDLRIREFDLNLEQIAESDVVEIDAFKGKATIEGCGAVYIYDDGIYSESFKKLLPFPFRATYFEPVMLDSVGNIKTFAICSTSRFAIGEAVEKTFTQKLVIFYDKNRSYILMILAATIAAFAVTLFYNRRTRRYLVQIEKQKDELQRTHEALIEAQETIVAQEKFRQAKDIAGGFAHEIRNALFPARSALNRLKSADEEKLRDAAWTKGLAGFTDEAVERAVEMTQLISQYTKLESHREPEEVDIGEVISEVLRLLQFRIEEQSVGVRMSGVEGQTAEGNREQLQIVFHNIIVNALDALTGIDNSTILITLRRDEDRLCIRIEDNGPGIHDSDTEKVFDVFYSTKPDTGTGLGLAMVKKIIEMYGGSVEVRSQVGVGTTFDLKLKLYEDN